MQIRNVTPVSSDKTKLTIGLDLRLLCAVLLVVITAMLLLWRPWVPQLDAHARTVEVTGEATLQAEPDEYVFSPSYEFKNADKQAAIDASANKSDELVAKLKALGVPASKIKTSASGNPDYYIMERTANDITYTLSLTITADDRKLAQKVEDYLVTTTPVSTITPQANFSENKRKQLESKARNIATQEARAKADQSAKNLGFKVGSVKNVNDGSGFGIMPYNALRSDTISSAPDDKAASPTFAIQSGQNDLKYSVTVVYYIK